MVRRTVWAWFNFKVKLWNPFRYEKNQQIRISLGSVGQYVGSGVERAFKVYFAILIFNCLPRVLISFRMYIWSSFSSSHKPVPQMFELMGKHRFRYYVSGWPVVGRKIQVPALVFNSNSSVYGLFYVPAASGVWLSVWLSLLSHHGQFYQDGLSNMYGTLLFWHLANLYSVLLKPRVHQACSLINCSNTSLWAARPMMFQFIFIGGQTYDVSGRYPQWSH